MPSFKAQVPETDYLNAIAVVAENIIFLNVCIQCFVP